MEVEEGKSHQDIAVKSGAPMERNVGSIATQLDAAIRAARGALGPHGDLLPVGRLAEIDALLAEFARRRVQIAVYGEVKSGKSTLINALAGAELSPSAFEPLTSVPVRITYGPRNMWRAGERLVEDAAALARLLREESWEGSVNVETALDLLRLGGQVDLLDTPGVGSEARLDEVSAATLRSLDAVVLVVRYPALFTQYTRDLMKSLESDIGKLFVVWNLDADCADLTDAERAQHAENLRRDVAGAHELFLVDAKQGLAAAKGKDAEGLLRSGLARLREALSHFASSKHREVASIREAAKRSEHWLVEGERTLAERQAALRDTLDKIRKEVAGVKETAEKEAASYRARFAELQSTVARLGKERSETIDGLVAESRQRLLKAAANWSRSGESASLQAEVAEAMRLHADGVKASCRTASHGLMEAAKRFETVIDIKPPARSVPSVAELAPRERFERANAGSLQRLRRSVFRRWYLPGLEELSQRVLDTEAAALTGWCDGASREVEKAARTTLERHLSAISSNAELRVDRIRLDAKLAAVEAEFEALTDHLAALARELGVVRGLSVEAKGLTSTEVEERKSAPRAMAAAAGGGNG